MRPSARVLPLLAALAGFPAAGRAQAPLGLAEAMDRAARNGYANRIAAGQTADRSGQALAPLRGILPAVRLEGGYVRTTDPLNAFGFTLRQRLVTPAAFAPAALNDPDPRGNVAAGMVVEQPLFNADAWLGRRAAGEAHAAQAASEAWIREGTALDVFRAYWGAVLAAEQVKTLETAHAAALRHVREAELMVEQGMATRSDALLARVKAGEVQADLSSASAQALLSRRRLALLMGEPGDTAFTLPAALPPADAVRRLTTPVGRDTASITPRADLAAAAHARAAAEADLRRATSLYLPRVNAVGRLDWNDPSRPFGGRSSWTVGVMVAWSPFSGGSELAERKAAAGRRDAARAMEDAAAAQAGLDLAEADAAVLVALERMDIAEQAVAQSAEAHRIVGKKYTGGLAGVTELFDAEAAETGSALSLVSARYDALVAAARRLHALGLDLAALVEVEQ